MTENRNTADTIAAISTATAPGGIGIVRISGPDALAVADRVFTGKNGKKLSTEKTFTLHYGHASDQEEVLDEVLASVMRGPHSYTGEDVAEINCHGGILSAAKVLRAVLHAGARPAEPGEFTRRAFLNGRIDLSQAEAVMDIISAKNELALKNSVRQLEGGLSEKIKEIRQGILYETARIEAALDDPEHMSLDGYTEILQQHTETYVRNIEALLQGADAGILRKEGIKTVIAGKPNAGKSSLLNLLTGEEKAIVTDIAGTTRDVLEEQVNIRGITLRLLDTAGIRDADNQIEKIGVEKARKHMEDADLIICVLDRSLHLDENDREILRIIREKKAIVLLNKSDLPPVLSEEELREKTSAAVISFSARNKEGLDELEKEIERLFFRGDIAQDDEVCITSYRHRAALEEARDALQLVLQSVRDEMPEDFFSIDLMGACDALGKITGESAGEDLVNEIFSKFCMGK